MFLGLLTLDIMQMTKELIYKRHKINIDFKDIDIEDPCIYKLINDGHLTGLFQIDSSVFRDAISKIKPNKFNEIADILALSRGL